MPAFANFVGPSYTSRSLTVAADRTVNLYPEVIESRTGKNVAALYGCPGLTQFIELPTSPVRGIWIGEDRMFVAAGSKLYEVESNGATDERGDIGAGSGPVEMIPTGTQLIVIAGGTVYVDTGTELIVAVFNNGEGVVDTNGTDVAWVSGDKFDASLAGNTITINGVDYTVDSVTDDENLVLTATAGVQSGVAFLATLPLTNFASHGVFLDGYIIVSKIDSKEIYISQLLDAQAPWDALDFAVKEGYPDNIAALLADHEELWIFGTQTIEVWRNTGNADFPFERDPSAFNHMGCIAQWTPVRLSGGVAWLGGDPRGHAVAYRAQGFFPVRISTHAVENAWAGYSTVADAEAFTMTLDGHEWWVINFPTADATWVFDATTELWHERQYASGGRHRARNHGYVWGAHYVGDYESGKIYRTGNDLYTDAGISIQRIRRCPHLSRELERQFFSAFRVDMEPTTGLAATLSWSNNGGRTFSTPIPPSGPKVANGTPADVVGQEWRRLGSARDRVFELKVSASSRIAISQAYLA